METLDEFREDLLHTVGRLNKASKAKQLFWGIKKNSWEDFYRIEVSSQNFDNRPSLMEEVDFIDDALVMMAKFAEDSEGHGRQPN